FIRYQIFCDRQLYSTICIKEFFHTFISPHPPKLRLGGLSLRRGEKTDRHFLKELCMQSSPLAGEGVLYQCSCHLKICIGDSPQEMRKDNQCSDLWVMISKVC